MVQLEQSRLRNCLQAIVREQSWQSRMKMLSLHAAIKILQCWVLSIWTWSEWSRRARVESLQFSIWKGWPFIDPGGFVRLFSFLITGWANEKAQDGMPAAMVVLGKNKAYDFKIGMCIVSNRKGRGARTHSKRCIVSSFRTFDNPFYGQRLFHRWQWTCSWFQQEVYDDYTGWFYSGDIPKRLDDWRNKK